MEYITAFFNVSSSNLERKDKEICIYRTDEHQIRYFCATIQEYGITKNIGCLLSEHLSFCLWPKGIGDFAKFQART